MPKSDQQKAEARRQVEARRQPDNSREGHDAKRGVKLPKFTDVKAKELSPEHIPDLKKAFKEESDRGLAILLATLAEHGLEWGIYRRMPGLGEALRKKTFSGDKAPLGTFSAKITMGRAMGIYGPETERLLNDVRAIRNMFAHTLMPIKFSTPGVAEGCFALKVPTGLKPLPRRDSAKGRYRLACTWLYIMLVENAASQTATFRIDLP